MSLANEKQVGGKHYQSAFQHWDFVNIVSVPYLPAQVIKYLSRWQKKNGLQDLEKAEHFLEKHIEQERDRFLQSQTLLDNYCRASSLGFEEKHAVRALVMHGLGDSGQLAMAKACVHRLIRAEKQRFAEEELVLQNIAAVEEPENPMCGDDP